MLNWKLQLPRVGLSMFLLIAISYSTLIVPVVEAACSNSEFQCIYQDRCIDATKHLNGVNDCYDNSDEVVGAWCEKRDSFQCSTSKSCVPISYRNDGDHDCFDASDEGKIIGSACNTSQCCPCELFVPNSHCDTQRKQCTCDTGYYPSALLNECPARIIGDTCAVDVDCSTVIEHSACPASKCACNDGYYGTHNGTVCTPRVLGDTCNGDVDCFGAMEGSVCTNNLCVCHHDWFDYTNRTACWHLLLGDVCTRDSLCYAGINHAYCSSGICNCTVGYIWKKNVRDVCRNRLIGLDHCDKTADCGIANSFCDSSNVCLCKTKYSVTPDNYQCTTRIIGEPCTSNAQCSGLNHAFCNNVAGTCSCTSGYKPTSNRGACVNNEVGDPCITDSDCSNSFLGGYCTANKACGCLAGFLITTKNVCRPRKIGIDSCATDVDCYGGVPNSGCVAGLCNCDNGFTVSPLSNTVCVLSVLTSTPCVQDTHCSGYNGSVCGVNGFCTCLAKYITSPFNCTEMQIGGLCDQLNNCTVFAHSTCDPISMLCRCSPGYVEENATTCRRRILGLDPCTVDFDCSSGVENSVCAGNNTCICGPGYLTTDDYNFCLDSSASTQTCSGFASCKPWAIALIIIFLLLPPLITGGVMFTYKNIQTRKNRLKQLMQDHYVKYDLYRDLGMAAIPTITNFTAPYDTALHTLPEIGAEWSYIENDDTSGLVIRDKSFFKDIPSISSRDGLLTKVEL